MDLSVKQLEILLVAEKLFAKKGFGETSIRRIAKEANINIAMVSYYFGSKEKMLGTLLHYRLSDYKIQMQNVISGEMDFLEKLDQIVALTIQRVHKNRWIHKIVNIEFSKGSLQLNFDAYLQQKKENYLMIEDFVRSGQKAGVFKKDIQIKLVMPTILGTYFHFYYNKIFFQSLLNIDDETAMGEYVKSTLTPHIKRTIKALLTYENQ